MTIPKSNYGPKTNPFCRYLQFLPPNQYLNPFFYHTEHNCSKTTIATNSFGTRVLGILTRKDYYRQPRLKVQAQFPAQANTFLIKVATRDLEVTKKKFY
jgi:hypothetical protein